MERTKEDYIQHLEPGMLVAFKSPQGVKSGKVLSKQCEIIKLEEFSGQLMYIKDSDVIWVKTGKRWPKSIFEALRGGDCNGKEDRSV